jgi:hypothetical protein
MEEENENYLMDLELNARLVAKSIQFKLLPLAERMVEESKRKKERTEQDNATSRQSRSVHSDTHSERSFTPFDETEPKKPNKEKAEEATGLSLLQKEEISVSCCSVSTFVALLSEAPPRRLSFLQSLGS